ncbi:type III secretion chaperone SycN [Bordetella pertussis]|uniref:Type III secretion chaperone SycN n=4 Tax=Bordetella pertussis TaxID=520 RepID=Q79GP9_BORPE|nr:type III secretion chaperone SycN [Bordetella pertussis]ETH38933.1 type III secretion chaperone SycN [Bordetella pertussis H918]ETH44690.1 type III secretion chaperone SycN [Bordetella pertussis H939]ETH48471.1 type III secretion chaperone SycN [Bordetella pertussis H921]ETH71426.1 type III secretion chaperone SycN [Bordetella pertussis STO1-CHLA-0011]ETH84097.1 type III secretion chaperone SycN [Bordetella pertussis STO1-CHOC-0017]ETH87959.1 type III secretion chaperone SycN [Bordetella p
MNTADRALHQFGQDIGIEGLAFGPSGSASLALSNGRRLGVECVAGAALVHLAQRVERDAASVLLAAWKRAHGQRGSAASIQTSLWSEGSEDWIVAQTRLPERSLDAAALRLAVLGLTNWLDRLEA